MKALITALTFALTACAVPMQPDTLATPAAPKMPYQSLAQWEGQARYQGEFACYNQEAYMARRLFVQVDETHAYYLYYTATKFALALAESIEGGDTARTIWLGTVGDKGIMTVTDTGPYSEERYGDSPCTYLYPDAKSIQRQYRPDPPRPYRYEGRRDMTRAGGTDWAGGSTSLILAYADPEKPTITPPDRQCGCGTCTPTSPPPAPPVSGG